MQFDICNLPFAISPLHAEPHDPLADRETLLELAAWCQRFSPTVGVEDGSAPESLFLDITGLDHLFGGEAALAGKVARDFAQRGFVVRIAIADTLGAAWAAARFGDCKLQLANSKYQIENFLVPTLCVGTHTPAALRPGQERTQSVPRERSHAERGNEESAFCNLQFDICNLQSAISNIPPHQTSAALRPLPIEALRLPEETVELLHSLGISRIEQLELLPREELGCRFGPRLVERWDQAVGRLPEPIPVAPPPPKFDARHALEYPTASRAAVSLVVEELVDRVAQMLVRCGRGAVRLECRLDCQSAGPVQFVVGLFQPTASPHHLGQLVAMHLERLSLPSPVTAVAIEAVLTGPLDHRQEDLFADGPARSRPRLLALLVDRLTSRLGRSSVFRPRLLPEAQPELAYRYDSLVWGSYFSKRGSSKRNISRPLSHESTGASSLSQPLPHALLGTPSPKIATARRTSPRIATPRRTREEAQVLPPRPLRLLRQPIALAAISVMPDGPPFSFRLRGREYRIARSWGPERIETGWWRGRPIARDYYRVETTTGQRFWLFRSLEEGRWFLHGNFE